jgi:zinc and cadmium transporter
MTIPILLSVLIVSAVSLVGILLFVLSESFVRRAIVPLVSFSTGVLLGDVFIHMIPELSENNLLEKGVPYILGGILASFVIEKIVHWQHCHVFPSEDHHHPVGIMTLVGDGVHNFVDGLLIAGSFFVSMELGIATTVAVVLHEIPQEIGDFAILLYSGYSRSKAVLFNLLSAACAILGALIAIFFVGSVQGIEHIFLSLAAGNFLYIAGTDLLPELHKHTKISQGIVQLLCMLAGIGVMYAMLFLE